jgi:hypothetical protein
VTARDTKTHRALVETALRAVKDGRATAIDAAFLAAEVLRLRESKPATLVWHKWEGVTTVPLNEPLLVETGADRWRTFQVAVVTKDGDRNMLGIVGGRFHWDVKIVQWARLADVIGEGRVDKKGRPA